MEETLLKLHLGCGPRHLNGYVNIDKYHLSANRVMDASKLDYSDNCVDEIFASHMIEHLTYSEFIAALKEWRRVLKIQKGRLIIRCPNFERHLKNWLEASYEERFGKRNYGVNVILGWQDKGLGNLNRNVFTVKRLRMLIEEAKFEVLKCSAVKNRDGKISDGDILLTAKIKNESNNLSVKSRKG